MQSVEQPHIDYKQLYEQQIAVIEKMAQQLEAHSDQVTALSAEVAKLRKMIFGVRVERFIPSADATPSQLQLALDLSADTVSQCKITSATTINYIRTKTEVIPVVPKAHPGRMKLPDHLRRETILLKPDGDIGGLKKIGEEVTEILDYVPGELYVKRNPPSKPHCVYALILLASIKN